MASTGLTGSTLLANLRADHVGALDLRPLCTARPDTTIRDAVRCMVDRRAGCVVVVHSDTTGGGAGGGGHIAGIFTERDFVSRVVAPSLDVGLPVARVMTPDPRTITTAGSIQSAVEAMGTGGFRHLPVVDDAGRPVGVLTVKDVVHYLVEYFPAKVYNLPPTPELVQPAREGA